MRRSDAIVVQTLGQVARGRRSGTSISVLNAFKSAVGDANESVVYNVSGTTSKEVKESIVDERMLVAFGCERVTVITTRNQTVNKEKQ